MTVGTWRHICVQRSSGTTKLFVNGTQEGSTYTDANNYLESTITIGDLQLTNSYNMNAYLSDFVVYKGIAKYNHTSFTAPTSAYNITTDPNVNYIILASNFGDLSYQKYSNSLVYPSFFNQNPVNNFIKTDQHLIGIGSNGYYGYANKDNLTKWYSGRMGTNNLISGDYTGISTDRKIAVIDDVGDIYISGIL
jgi:hypothetical protein